MSEAVKVMVRCRPMNQKEKDRSNSSLIFLDCCNVVQVDFKNNSVHLVKEDNK